MELPDKAREFPQTEMTRYNKLFHLLLVFNNDSFAFEVPTDDIRILMLLSGMISTSRISNIFLRNLLILLSAMRGNI
jgi:hypothetical protein